ncbi:MAG: hypothetical protein ACI9AF_000993 [Granulosicoccus sp.]|jgi:hypothetical protein
MKNITITTMAALLFGSSGLFAQNEAFTKPSGFETLTLAPGAFNLIGVRLFNPVVVSGTFESQDGSSLTDDEANFALTAATSYIVEFSNGASITPYLLLP